MPLPSFRSLEEIVRRALVLSVLLAAVALPAIDAAAQAPTAETLKVEWSRRVDPWSKPTVEGYVYNDSGYRIGSVLLRVQLLDGSQRVVAERKAWLYGNIPAGDRGYFRVPILPEDGDRTYRISVDSFVLIAREATQSP